MKNEELYDKVIEAFNSGDDNHFAAAARNWVTNAKANPFMDKNANALLGEAKKHYNLWSGGGISSRVSKTRMIDCIRKIAEMGLDNPYRDYQKKTESKQIALGVVPDPAPLDPSKVSHKQPKEPLPPKEPPKEPRPEKHIFPRRKKP